MTSDIQIHIHLSHGKSNTGFATSGATLDVNNGITMHIFETM